MPVQFIPDVCDVIRRSSHQQTVSQQTPEKMRLMKLMEAPAKTFLQAQEWTHPVED